MKSRMLLGSAIVLSAAFVALSQQNAPDDVILRAMHDEIDRSRQLRVVGGSDEAPYYISYTLEDSDSLHVSASMGAMITSTRNHFRVPNVEVRIGNYDFDDTGHIYSGVYTGSRLDSGWPLDDHYQTIRNGLWLSTDRAYKTALESMARKRAALNSANAPVEKLADFSKADPVRSIEKTSRHKLDEAAWQARMVKLSAVFNAYPETLSSSVDGQAIDGVSYLVNNEGTALRYYDGVTFVYAKAEGQAPDGMIVRDAVSFQSIEPDQFPSESEMNKGATAVAENIRALVKAPIGSGYSGPTMFEPGAAAQLLAQVIGDNLYVPRKPLSEPGRAVNFLPSELESKIGSRILPDWMDVTDDPTQSSSNGRPLMGFYPFDLEGVAGKPVSIVEKGVLKNFLTTRQPIKGSTASNGHARFPGPYGSRAAAISNLIVKANETTSLADVKKKLLEMCQQRSKPYGMLVRKLDYPFSAGANELRTLASGQSGGSARPVSPPLLVYRVYADGREELVRGLRFRGLNTRSLRDILAATKEVAQFDYVNNAAPLAILGAGGYMSPTSVISPGLLFDEVEFELPQEQLPKPPTVPPPTNGN